MSVNVLWIIYSTLFKEKEKLDMWNVSSLIDFGPRLSGESSHTACVSHAGREEVNVKETTRV